MVELYWMALVRDINVNHYPTNSLAQAAADNLSNQPAFRGPRQDGKVGCDSLMISPFSPKSSPLQIASAWITVKLSHKNPPVGAGI
jgi:hypothetical protein